VQIYFDWIFFEKDSIIFKVKHYSKNNFEIFLQIALL